LTPIFGYKTDTVVFSMPHNLPAAQSEDHISGML